MFVVVIVAILACTALPVILQCKFIHLQHFQPVSESCNQQLLYGPVSLENILLYVRMILGLLSRPNLLNSDANSRLLCLIPTTKLIVIHNNQDQFQFQHSVGEKKCQHHGDTSAKLTYIFFWLAIWQNL